MPPSDLPQKVREMEERLRAIYREELNGDGLVSDAVLRTMKRVRRDAFEEAAKIAEGYAGKECLVRDCVQCATAETIASALRQSGDPK